MKDYLIILPLMSAGNLSLSGNALFFRDKSSAGTGKIARILLKTAASKPRFGILPTVFNIRRIPAQLTGSTTQHSHDSTIHLKEYVAMNCPEHISKTRNTVSQRTIWA